MYDGNNILQWFFIPYFIVQLALPLRHYFIKGDVLWTEEGHRLSWRMMLRTRNGSTDYRIVDKKTKEVFSYPFSDELTYKQQNGMETKPDMIWQLAQRIKHQYAEKGKDVAVYAKTKVSVNGSPYKMLIDPNTDLAAASWNYFGHSEWVLLYDKNGNRINN
jgi:hypothetical protein